MKTIALLGMLLVACGGDAAGHIYDDAGADVVDVPDAAQPDAEIVTSICRTSVGRYPCLTSRPFNDADGRSCLDVACSPGAACAVPNGDAGDIAGTCE